MLIITLNGKGINAACTSYAGKVIESLRLSCTASSQMQSQDHFSLATVGKHIGSAILLCRAATDELWESVLVQQSEWHWGAPEADLEENRRGSKEHAFFTHMDVGT